MNKQSGTPAGNPVKRHYGELFLVPKDYFITEQVDTKGMTLTEFCDKHGLRKKRLNIFLDVSQMVQKPIKVRDVLLMDEVIYYVTRYQSLC